MREDNSTQYQIFLNLVGVWKVERTMEGVGVLNGCAQFQGIATFEKLDDERILYSEKGVFTSGDDMIEDVYKRYLYTYDPEGEGISVWFDRDAERQELFHTLCFSDDFLNAHGSHVCGKDSYDAEYDFENGCLKMISYQVTSDAQQHSSRQKNYVIKTAFSPESA